MITSLKNKAQDTNPERTLDYTPSISNNNAKEIKNLLSKFEMTTGFNAHQKFINEILNICEHHYNKRIFSPLKIHQKLMQDFQPYAELDIEPVAPQGKRNNLVMCVGKRSIAALILKET